MQPIKINCGAYELEWIKVQLTRRCNFRCQYCSQADWASNEVLDVDGFIQRILSQVAVRALVITGGEPLAAFPELVHLCQYCRQRGLEVGIFSNGSLVCADKAAHLQRAGLSWARISLNGSCAAVHEQSYPEGTFQHTRAGVVNLIQAGIYTKARTTISALNLNDIPQYLEHLVSLGVRELDARPYLPLGLCNPHGQFLLSPEQLMEVSGALCAYRVRFPQLNIKLLPGWFDFLAVSATSQSAPIEACHCGRQNIYVDVNLVIAPCAGHRMKVGTLETAPLEELWRKSPVLHEMRAYDQAAYCQACPCKAQCHRSSCSLINYEVYGSFSHVNPLCPVFKLCPQDPVEGIAKSTAIFWKSYHATLKGLALPDGAP